MAAETTYLDARRETSALSALERVFDSDFFSGERVPPIRWTPDAMA